MGQGVVISLGSVAADFELRAARRPEVSETLLAEGFAKLGGGKGANVAALARRLGVPAALVYPGTYRAGLYNRRVREVDGEAVANESLVNPPDWAHLEVRLAGGVPTRDLRFRDPAGRESRLRETRLVSMAQPHLAGLRVELTKIIYVYR